MPDRVALPAGPDLGPVRAYLARRRDILGMLTRIAAEHPRIAHVRVLKESVYMVNHPELVHETLVVNARSVKKGSGFERAIPFLGAGLFTNDGDVHKRHRRLLQPAFHKAKIEQYAQLMVDIARAVQWREGEEVDLAEEMARITLDVATQTLFGTDLDDEDAVAARESLNDFVSVFHRLGSPYVALLLRMPTPLRRQFEGSRQRFDALLHKLVDQRRAEPRDDFLTMLLESGLDEDEIFDEVRTFVPASHETTANALTWTMWLLHQHPGILARLQAEVDSLPGLPEAADYGRLPFTRAVVSESMRLFPPIYVIGRRATADMTVDGFHIPAGSRLITSPWVTHRDPRWWGDDAADFRPDRWLDDAGTFALDNPGQGRMTYFPFGMGPRICIGEQFAWLETVLVVATLMRQWSPRVLVDVQPMPGPMLRTAGPVMARIEARSGVTLATPTEPVPTA